MMMTSDEDNNFENVDEDGLAPGQGGGGVGGGQDSDGGDQWGSQHHRATGSARQHRLLGMVAGPALEEEDRVCVDQQKR